MSVDYQYFEFQAYEYLLRLGQLWEKDAELPQIRELLKKLRAEQEQIRTRKFRVAVVGEFKRGKSSFINALLGKELLPVDALPTTATLNRITYGAVPRAYLRYKDGSEEQVEIGELSRYVTKLTGESEDAAARIEEAVVEYPSIFCQNHVDLIDTPGMNDDMSMNEVTLAQLEHIDLAIVTLSPGSPFSETESRFMARLLESDEICRIIVVVTKIDEVRGKEKRRQLLSYLAGQVPEKTLERLKENHEEGDPVFEKFRRIFQDLPMFGVCSLDALEARQHGDEELFVKSGFAELYDRLPQLILVSQNNNTVLRAVHTVRKAVRSYRNQLPAMMDACGEAEEAIRRERKEFAEKCYGLAEPEHLEELKRKLWERVDAFSSVQEEISKGFIRCLSGVRILDGKILEQALKIQAASEAENVNRRIAQVLLPELEEIVNHELPDWYQNIRNWLSGIPRLQEKGMEEVKELVERFAPPPSPAIFSEGGFFWKPYPVPGREKLLAPDLIVYVRQAVSASIETWCDGKKKQIEKRLWQFALETSKELEKIVVALYQAEDQRIALWEEKEDRLPDPDFLEKLEQLEKENDCLEANFLEKLSEQ